MSEQVRSLVSRVYIVKKTKILLNTSPSSLLYFSSILPVSYTMSCVKRALGNHPHHRLQIAVCVGIIFLSSLCSNREFLTLGNDSSLLGI